MIQEANDNNVKSNDNDLQLLQSPALLLVAVQNKRSKNIKTKSLKIKKGCRVKVIRRNLFRALKELQQDGFESYRNSWNFYSNIISGNRKQGCNIKFDNSPLEDQIEHVKRRDIISTLNENEDEQEYDHNKDCKENKKDDNSNL